MLEPCRVSLVSERRRARAARRAGGEPGAPGRNLVNGDELPAQGDARPRRRRRRPRSRRRAAAASRRPNVCRKGSASRVRFRPPHRRTFGLSALRLPLASPGADSTYSRPVLAAGGKLRATPVGRQGAWRRPRAICEEFRWTRVGAPAACSWRPVPWSCTRAHGGVRQAPGLLVIGRVAPMALVRSVAPCGRRLGFVVVVRRSRGTGACAAARPRRSGAFRQAGRRHGPRLGQRVDALRRLHFGLVGGAASARPPRTAPSGRRARPPARGRGGRASGGCA